MHLSDAVQLALIGLVGTMIANIFTMWRTWAAARAAAVAARGSMDASRANKAAIAEVHGIVNSQTDNWKKLAAEQYEKALEHGVEIAKLAAEKIAAEAFDALTSKIAVNHARIAALEEALATSTAKVAEQAGTITDARNDARDLARDAAKNTAHTVSVDGTTMTVPMTDLTVNVPTTADRPHLADPA